MDDQEPTETTRGRVARTTVEAGAIGAAAVTGGLMIGGPLGAITGGGVTALATAWHSVRRAATERAEQVVERGVELAEITPDCLAAWVEADPRHAALLVAVVEAGARSTTEAHLDALAQVLADGCHDDDRLDVDTLLARTLGDLGPAHLQVLDRFDRAYRTYREHCVTPQQLSEERGRALLGAQGLGRAMPHLAEGIDALFATLTGRGCIVAETAGRTYGGTSTYRVTTFGSACLGFLGKRTIGGECS